MHELSIAKALLQLAERYRPPTALVREVHVQAGPLQAIDDDAMQWAWQAATRETAYADAELRLQRLPWPLRCADCGRCWQSDSPERRCSCGAAAGVLNGGDELLLTSLEVEEVPPWPELARQCEEAGR